MEHRWWATNHIFWSKSHCSPDELCIVDEVSIGLVISLHLYQFHQTYVCVSIAALGDPVVPLKHVSMDRKFCITVFYLPEVNCKLTTSSRVTFLSARSSVALFMNTERPFEVNVI